MSGKAKFNLLSILIEDKLIFYKSINKSKKLIAFSIFTAYDAPKIILILNELLSKRLLKTYSIQIKVSSRTCRSFLLYFEDEEKEKILSSFNLIHQKLLKEFKYLHFFQKKTLRKKFYTILTNQVTPLSEIYIDNGSISIKSKQRTIFLKCFQIKLINISNKIPFLHTLVKLLRNFQRSGFIIFNISLNNYNEISLCAYYLDVSNDKKNTQLDLENEINLIFKSEIFERNAIPLNLFYKIIWRNSIKNKLNIIENVLDFFIPFSIYNFQNITLFSNQFEKILKLNHIEVHRLNRNLLLLEQSVIILIVDKLDIGFIEKILTKYLSSHKIFLLILSMKVYNEIVKLEKIETIRNLKILNINDIIRFDFMKIKKNAPN